jgi:hypothetical protein
MVILGVNIVLEKHQLNRLVVQVERECPEVYNEILNRGSAMVLQDNNHPGYEDDICNGCGNHYEWCECYHH